MNKGGGKASKLRIIGGELRHRQVAFAAVEGLRPTADRIRETLFNWLQQDIVGARCLDLFAGSGALGIEAMSRGAASVEMVEKNREAVKMLQHNVTQFGLEEVRIHRADVMGWLAGHAGCGHCYDVVFIDPPYAQKQLARVCQALQNARVLAGGANIYLESDTPLSETELPVQWSVLKQKRAGQVYYYLCQYQEEDLL